ncbi:LLM class flavin-dependent oxidoreductase [Sphingomonas jatrophae]|uniref:Alkanesulfonate monooxygenase n=1 Tax=Sphingomonas jatrophae TaxID=1166337 RepID=A0A1I6K9W7_9SPHN|nr:LLM class flavin-dependent oxidoreductase [Sphingomonas jatrophae]SFR88009.1 alkanesulfonate monooxygenase [Sphingomonas jatrophae]
MPVEIFWRLPTHGDGRKAHDRHTRGEWNKLPPALRKAPGERHGKADGFGYIDYLGQVARAAEINGFDGALVPTSGISEQSWIVAAALARETRRLRFMVAHQAGFTEPHFAAQSAATLQRITGGRVDINIITGGSSKAQRALGDFLDHDSRYLRTGEFLDVFKRYWKEGPLDYRGELYRIEKGGFKAPLRDTPLPPIYFAGSSQPAIDVAADHADVYLVWAEPVAGNVEQFDRVRKAAAQRGRLDKVRFGVRVDIIARDTEKEAWDEARRLFATATETSKALFNELGRDGKKESTAESAGAQRQWALHKGRTDSFDDLIVAPNLWAGMSILRGGPSCGIIGSYQQIADRLAEYVDAGASSFILASNPHLEEAYNVGEEILPLLGDAIAGLHNERVRAA